MATKYKHTSARQEGGDDGYCWVIRVHGEERLTGLTLREVPYYRAKFEAEEEAKLAELPVKLDPTDDHYNDPPEPLKKRLGEMGFSKSDQDCHNYGKGDDGFCDRTYRLVTRDVTKVLREFGYVRDTHQYRGHTNYIHPVSNQLAQVYTDVNRLHVTFHTLAERS